jgi:hypothetical protein
MNSIKTIATTAAFVLALSGYAFAQSTRRGVPMQSNRGAVIVSSGGVVDTIPSAVNRVPSAVNRVPSAVNSAPSAVESSGSSNTTRSRSTSGVDETLMR